MTKGRHLFRSRNTLLCKIESDDLVTIVWRTLKKAGLIMNLNTGEIHWITYITSVILTAFTLMQLIELYIFKADPLRLLECISILCFFLLALYKLFALRWYGKQWGYLLQKTTEIENTEREEENCLLDYESDSENDFSLSMFYERYTESFRYRNKVLTRIYSLTVMVFIISPFVEYVLRKYRNQNIAKYPHVLPIWTPLDGVSVYGYLLTVILEIVATLYGVGVHTVFDVAAIGLMTFLQGQFYLLHAKSERIAGNGKMYKYSKTRDNRAHKEIKNCHRIHVALITFVKQINQLTRNIFGLYSLMATIILCSVNVQLKKDLSATHFVCLLHYMAGILAQLFILSYHGDAVQNESAICVGRGPLNSAWWCLSPRIRKELIILHFGMSVQYQLDAGPFFHFNLPTFVKVLRTAYSWYAVFKQV